MCGIFGLIDYGTAPYLKLMTYQTILKNLLKESQTRGRDASGLCVVTTSKIAMFKDKMDGETLAKSKEINKLMKKMHEGRFRSAIGHTRSQTKGTEWLNANNHPIVAGGIVGVHNGVIVNDDYLFDEFGKKLDRSGMVDSEIIFRLIDHYRRLDQGQSLIEAVRSACSKLTGSYRCAFVDRCNSRYVTIFHNDMFSPCVALYVFENEKTMIFASSEFIIDNALLRCAPYESAPVKKYDIKEGGVRIDTDSGELCFFNPKSEKRALAQQLDISEKSRAAYGQCSDSDCMTCEDRTCCML